MLFWNSVAFSMIQQMLAIWSLVPLPFLKPAWTKETLICSRHMCMCVCEWCGFISILKSCSIPTFHSQPSPAKCACVHTHTHAHSILLVESSYFFLVFLSELRNFITLPPTMLMPSNLQGSWKCALNKIFWGCVCSIGNRNGDVWQR